MIGRIERAEHLRGGARVRGTAGQWRHGRRSAGNEDQGNARIERPREQRARRQNLDTVRGAKRRSAPRPRRAALPREFPSFGVYEGYWPWSTMGPGSAPVVRSEEVSSGWIVVIVPSEVAWSFSG